MSSGEDWPEADIARLRALWAEGFSVVAIGVVLARTKSSVIGKVHRLGLSSRPSPIVREGPRAVAVKRRAVAMPPAPPLPPVMMPMAARPVCKDSLHTPMPPHAREGCQFVTDDTRYAQRFCDAPRAPESSYCAPHHALCHITVHAAGIPWRFGW
jgi:GcrA cell cycle regulator